MFQAVTVPLWAGVAITPRTFKASSAFTQDGKAAVTVMTKAALTGAVPLMFTVYGHGYLMRFAASTLGQVPALPLLTKCEGVKHETRFLFYFLPALLRVQRSEGIFLVTPLQFL